MVNAVLGSPLFPAKKKNKKKHWDTTEFARLVSLPIYTYYLAAGLGL